MRKVIVLGLILFCLISSVICIAQGSEVQCDPPPPGPAPDNPDDNYSFYIDGNQSANISFDFERSPYVGIFKKGNVIAMDNLLGKIGIGCFYVETDFNPGKIVDEANVLIISTGGLMGIEKSEYLKALLEQFAAQGGTIICLGQQNSDAYGVLPVPQGESLNAYGWSQDSSCLRNSAYFESTHPALSSSTNELIDVGVDGYFSVYPSNSTILLKRKINLEPALLYYPYGNGTVILTSMFTDWAYAHSQATTSEIKIIRDLITFAKNPRMPIPMFDLEQNPTPAINLNAQVENNTEFTASKAILKVYTPDRTTLLHQLDAPVNLNPGETTQAVVNFTLPELQTKDYGICQVDYELYNPENEIIQLPTESDSGRFSIYKIITPVTIKDAVYMWVTVKDEEVYYGQDVECTIHFKNTTSETKTLDINDPFFAIGHGASTGPSFPSFNVTLPPDGEYAHIASFTTTGFSSPYVKWSLTFRVQYRDANGVLKQAGPGKVIFVLGAVTDSALKLNGSQNTNQFLNPGGPINYDIASQYLSNPIPGISTIKLSLEKGTTQGNTLPQNSEYTEIKTLFQTTHDFMANGNFHYSGAYTPQPIHTAGWYRLKLEVIAPNGVKEANRYQYLSYKKSNFNVDPGTLQTAGSPLKYLIPGASYTIPIKIKNPHYVYGSFQTYDVQNGCFELLLESPSGQEVYKKSVTDINIPNNTEQTLSETFVFHPIEKGKYILKYRYWDESKEEPLTYFPLQSFLDGSQISIRADKSVYNYGDTANITVDITGAGAYHLDFKCPETGISEERDIQVPEGTYRITEQFQAPIGLSPSYYVEVTARDSAARETIKYFTLSTNPLTLDYQGSFGSIQAQAGNNLAFNANIKILSGAGQPLNGQLIISSSQLNYQDVKNVTLQPLVDNPFTNSIPITADTPVGEYPFNVLLTIDNVEYLSKYHSITLPAAKLEFTEPAAAYNAGDTINLSITNAGGKSGTFDIQALLKDPFNKTVLQKQETKNLAPGVNDTFQLTVPTTCKTESYRLILQTTETLTNVKSEKLFVVSVTGLTASLNSYTLKGNYFDNETITGKSEITSAGALENGTLKARVIRTAASSGGIEEETRGEFIPYNLMERAYQNGSKLYLATDKGLLEYDKTTKNITHLHDLDYNISKIFFHPNGELWLGTSGGGVLRRDTGGNWSQYTPDQGFPSYWVYDIIAANYSGLLSTWIASDNGVSVFNANTGAWKTFTTTNGLPSNSVYGLAVDGVGAVWALTYKGLAKFNGTSFVKVTIPTGTVNYMCGLTQTADGGIWLAYNDKLCKTIGGQWQEFPLSGICPGYTSYTVQEIENVNGQLWARLRLRDANANLINGLIQYTTTFTLYNETDYPVLKSLKLIIPAVGDDAENAAFICEIGFLEYQTGDWTHHTLDIDSHKLLGMIYCLVKDNAGRLWAGTQYGISMYDFQRQQWTNYYTLPGNKLILDVSRLDIDSENKIYGYYPYLYPNGGILKINNGEYEPLPFPVEFRSEYPDKMVVDQRGRVWVGYQKMYYYDGSWHVYPDIIYAHSLAKDAYGGLWAACWDSSAQFHLKYINSDLVIAADYTSANTPMLPWDKNRLYMDASGMLWLTGYAYNWNDVRTLESFDVTGVAGGTNWVNYTNYEGFPPYGVWNLAKDENGRIVVVDFFSNKLYYLDNEKNTFVLAAENITFNNSLIFLNGKLYGAGLLGAYHEYTEVTNLFKVNFSLGLTEEELWSQTYNVNLTSGESSNIDLLTNKILAQGNYTLKTELLSPLGQVLADSRYNFKVKAGTISVVLAGETDNTDSGNYLKPNEPRAINIEIQNNTNEDVSNLPYTLKKTSPSGTEEILAEQSLNLAAGQSYTDTLTFNETETGTWRLTVQAGTGSSCEMLLEVTQLSVTMEIIAPTYAGNEPFDININLKNEGKIKVEIRGQGSGVGGQVKLDETISLEPCEERVLTFNDTISTDTNYTVAITGDLEKSETVTVKYGYVENLSLNVLPAYREGTVNIDYTLSNTGGLPFTDTLHFELFNEGSAVPLYSIDRNYNLYPGESPINDSLNFSLSPGVYQLQYQSISIPEIQIGRELAPPVPSNTTRGTFIKAPLDPPKFLFNVLPSGIGNVILTTNNFPTGTNQIQYNVTNTDSSAGLIPITITIFGDDPTTPILTETRSYYLLPNQSLQDFIEYNFPQKSNYTLSISSPKIPTTIITPIQILNPDETTAALSIGSPETDHIPIDVNITNTGFNPFNGTLIIETPNTRAEEPITINSNSSLNQTFPIETSSLTAGTNNIKVSLLDASGNTLSQTTSSVTITGPDIKVTELPQNLEINAGSYADVALKLKNEGHLRGEARLKISAFDTLYQEREISLEPGEEITIDGISIDAPADCPTGNYPFNYTLSLTGPGVTNGLVAGNFTFKVNGITLNVEATLDRSLYNIGETAQLALSISSPNQSDAPLEAMINWGNFSEKRTFIMSSGSGGSVSLVFEIPLDEKRQEKVFYGIYHEGGKGIHLNDIYLHFKDKISVESDKQVYAPGEIIHAIFTLTGGDQTGIISVDAFGENQTLPLSSTVSATFQVPADTIGGTYGINWRFVPSNTSQEELSGSHSFDVSGLVVKVAKSELEKGKYSSGETIKAAYTFEANRDDSLALRCWVATPSNQWTYLGENSVTVSADRQNNAVSSYSFTTNEAGTHDLVYGLYKDDKLVVSGRLAFDVGDAVLMGIATDKYEYKDGNENVIVRIDYFGEKTETLSRKGFSTSQSFSLFMDNEKVEERTLTIDGPGHIEITLNSSRIGGGSHLLKAILTGDGLTSTKQTSFLYGTNLPDLTLTLTDNISEGLNYTYKIAVTNRGKTTSTATTLAFTDNGNPVETVSIPALAAGASQENIFNWSGSGKAGSHEFLFEIDPTNTVKEYSEDNNQLTLSEEVPLLFYNLEVEPIIWPANSDIIIITRLINNQNSITPLTLNLSIIHDSTGTAIFQRNRVEELPAFGNKALNDHFNTGVAPAGEYTLAQDVASDGATLHKEIDVLIETTKTISATLQLLPVKIPSGTDAEVEISMTLKNIGNVALEDETGVIEVVNKESEETVKAEQLLFTVPLGQEVAVKKAMTLNLVEGRYEIHLKYLDNVIGSAELTAAAAIKPEKIIAVRPRVLIMNLQMPGSADPVVFLNNLFQSAEIQHETAQGILESYFQFHKGHANINIVLGHTMGRRLRDELKERVWRGEGLILICGNPINAPDMVDWLGVNVSPQTGKEKTQTVVEILPNELTGGGGQMELLEKNRLILEKKSADVVIVGQTLQKKQPVMTYRKYGRGHILVIAAPVAPLAYKSGGEMIAQLLVNAVNLFSGDIYTISTLTRVLPVEISLSNEGTEEKNLIVKEILPYGVEGYDYNPALEDTGEENEIQWSIKVPGGATENISYWLKLPDQAGNYEVKTEIHDGETKLEEVSLDVDVSQAVLSRIIDTVVELEALDVSGHDANAIRQAKTCLENIRGRSVGSLADHLQNLHDAVQAVESIGSVTGLDVSSLRLKAGDIMVIMGRRLYEEVKQWGPSRLNPFTGLITAD